MLWAQAEIIDKVKANWIYGAIGLGVLVVLFVLLKIAPGKNKPPDLERGLRVESRRNGRRSCRCSADSASLSDINAQVRR
jgi:hypothetical protein